MQQTNCEKLYAFIFALAMAAKEGNLLGTLYGTFKYRNSNKSETITLFSVNIKNKNNRPIKSFLYNLSKRLFSMKSHNDGLHPGFVTGFVDPPYITTFDIWGPKASEGCFTITISKNKDYKCGWRVHATFAIT